MLILKWDSTWAGTDDILQEQTKTQTEKGLLNQIYYKISKSISMLFSTRQYEKYTRGIGPSEETQVKGGHTRPKEKNWGESKVK